MRKRKPDKIIRGKAFLEIALVSALAGILALAASAFAAHYLSSNLQWAISLSFGASVTTGSLSLLSLGVLTSLRCRSIFCLRRGSYERQKRTKVELNQNVVHIRCLGLLSIGLFAMLWAGSRGLYPLHWWLSFLALIASSFTTLELVLLTAIVQIALKIDELRFGHEFSVMVLYDPDYQE